MQARDYMQAMEQVDDCSVVFGAMMYGVTQTTKEMLSGFLNSEPVRIFKWLNKT